MIDGPEKPACRIRKNYRLDLIYVMAGTTFSCRALGDKETLLLHEEINSMKASISALKKSLIQKTDTHNRLFQVRAKGKGTMYKEKVKFRVFFSGLTKPPANPANLSKVQKQVGSQTSS